MEIVHRRSGRALLTVAGESLAGANLSGEYLIHADLRDANLTAALLPFANLSGADLTGANLTGANLRGVNLTEVDMTRVDFTGANLTHATLSLTIFADCRNLHRAVGLASVNHAGPSELDPATLRASAWRLPDEFLLGAGYTRSEIADMRRRFPARE